MRIALMVGALFQEVRLGYDGEIEIKVNGPRLHHKAYSYVRFSTPEQDHGDSFRCEAELSNRHAEDHGLDLDTSLNTQRLLPQLASGVGRPSLFPRDSRKSEGHPEDL